MENITDKINSFVELSKAQLKKGTIKKNEYTIIVFATKPMTGGRNIVFVYKDLDNFIKKIKKHSKKITDAVDLNFELWSFD